MGVSGTPLDIPEGDSDLEDAAGPPHGDASQRRHRRGGLATCWCGVRECKQHSPQQEIVRVPRNVHAQALIEERSAEAAKEKCPTQ